MKTRFGVIAQRISRPTRVPREFHMIGELPKSGVGKVLKTELRERLGSD